MEPTEQDFTNSRGIKFTQSDEEEPEPSPPYGLACIRELFSFLACITNPADAYVKYWHISIDMYRYTLHNAYTFL